MLSKTVYEYLGTDHIMRPIYDWLFEIDSGLMAALSKTMVTVEGNGVKYNVETADPVLSWLEVGDDVPEIQHNFTQRSAALYRFAGDAFVDKMRMAMVPSTEATEIKSATRALYRQWLQNVIYGQTTVLSSTKQIKGLFRLLAEIEGESTTDLDGAAAQNSQVIANHATEAALTLANLNRMMDQVKLGCNALIMSAQTQRKVDSLCNAAGTPVVQKPDEYKHNIKEYNGAKIYVVDALKNNLGDCSSSVLTISTYDTSTAWAGGANNAIIFGAHIGDDGLCMIQPPNGEFKKEPPFTSDKKDAWVHRFKCYTGLACYNKFGLAALIGITSDSET